MFGTLFSNLRAGNVNEPNITRRHFSRRYCDKCVAIINGMIYPVENWSMGGLMVVGDPRSFGVKDDVEIDIKFKTSNEVINVTQKASVVRKTSQKVAFQFEPITQKIKTRFQDVIDDYVATRFADPQNA